MRRLAHLAAAERDIARAAQAGAPTSSPLAHVGVGGAIRVADMSPQGTGKSQSDLALEAALPLEPPALAWIRRAQQNRLVPGWSSGEGADALSPEQLRCVIEYEGEILSEAAFTSRMAAGGSHTYIKLFKRQAGTPMAEAEYVSTYAIDASGLRARVRHLLTQRSAGAAAQLARYGLGCLSDGDTWKARCTAFVVRDGQRMFLVPRCVCKEGSAITHHYNPDATR